MTPDLDKGLDRAASASSISSGFFCLTWFVHCPIFVLSFQRRLCLLLMFLLVGKPRCNAAAIMWKAIPMLHACHLSCPAFTDASFLCPITFLTGTPLLIRI
jgi:hypothetical protein